MKIKMFEEDYKQDLETKVNEFLKTLESGKVIDVKYQFAFVDNEIYCYTCMIVYLD